MSITKEIAITLEYRATIEHKTAVNADGTPQRFRVNGRVKTWVTRPAEFRIPVIRGLYEYGYIDHENGDQFRVQE